jgi:hypothetical protein
MQDSKAAIGAGHFDFDVAHHRLMPINDPMVKNSLHASSCGYSPPKPAA